MEKEFLELLRKDEEIQNLKAKYYELFGCHRPYSIWEDGGIEGYRENLKKAIKDGA